MSRPALVGGSASRAFPKITWERIFSSGCVWSDPRGNTNGQDSWDAQVGSRVGREGREDGCVPRQKTVWQPLATALGSLPERCRSRNRGDPPLLTR